MAIDRSLKMNVDKRTCYKVLMRNGYPYYLQSPFRGMVYQAGFNRSDRPTTKVSSGMVNKGIHVFWTRNTAKDRRLGNEVIVPVTCLKRDFVGRNSRGEAVFMKVHLSKQAYRKVTEL